MVTPVLVVHTSAIAVLDRRYNGSILRAALASAALIVVAVVLLVPSLFAFATIPPRMMRCAMYHSCEDCACWLIPWASTCLLGVSGLVAIVGCGWSIMTRVGRTIPFALAPWLARGLVLVWSPLATCGAPISTAHLQAKPTSQHFGVMAI